MLVSLLGEAAVNGRPVSRLDPEWLRPFVDPSLVREAVRALAEEPWLEEREKIAVAAFLRTYEAREKGQDPDDVFL
jgi:hypothetical protein